jgi:hypothetical protein
MFALIDFVSRVVGDIGRFVDIFLNDLILGAGDPLSALLVLVGQVLILASVGALGYVAVGALLQEFGVTLPSLGGRGRSER